MSQTIFSVAPEVPFEVTFVVATQSDLDGKVSQVRQVNSHLASYKHAKRRRKVFGGQMLPNVENHGHERDNIKQKSLTNKRQSDARVNGTNLIVTVDPRQAEFDEPLLSVLDPFLMLPENISQLERSMLAFCRCVVECD